jgi:hypothetical protein
MRFGRVEGIVETVDDGGELRLRLIVTLETGDAFEVVRDEYLRPLRVINSIDDLIWHADQWTQETIGFDLAEEGWEAIGADEPPPAVPGELAHSARYAVRRLP